MREILFRGKRTDNGEWVEGNLYREESKTKIGDGEYSSSYITEICDVETRTLLSRGSFFIDNEFIQVSDETVGQYTGLKDKNGKKIFEGDILSDIDSRIYSVMYTETVAMWELLYEKIADIGYRALQITDFECVRPKELEVIGNIHDNPELLKEV